MLLTTSFKHLILRHLPEPFLQYLRKIHYARKLEVAPPEPEMTVIPHLLPACGCALDLGANFGLYAQFLARTVGAEGMVHAVEPVPGTFEVLRRNVRQLSLTNVRVHPVAISDRTGSAEMVIPQYSQGGDNLYEARIPSEHTQSSNRVVHVQTRRLDDLFGNLGCIDFVKCDVEAHELFVIRGASQILRIHRPAWLMEISGNPEDPASSAFELLRLMKNAGYQPYMLEAGEAGLAEHKRSGNCFFLRPEHVRRLGVSCRS